MIDPDTLRTVEAEWGGPLGTDPNTLADEAGESLTVRTTPQAANHCRRDPPRALVDAADIHERPPAGAPYPALRRLLEQLLRIDAELGRQSLRRGECAELVRAAVKVEGLRLPLILGSTVIGESGGHLTVSDGVRIG